jgi:hypothetical protein
MKNNHLLNKNHLIVHLIDETIQNDNTAGRFFSGRPSPLPEIPERLAVQ